MDALKVSKDLFRVANGATSLFIRVEGPDPDYTVHEEGNLYLESSKGQSAIFPFERNTIRSLIAMLKMAIDDNCILFTYNFKHLVSYYRKYTGKEDFLPGKVFDIRVIEHLVGIWHHQKAPATYQEASQRFTEANKDSSWKTLYKPVHAPLITDVIPAIETCGLIDDESREVVYPYYDIEGQKQGRLKAWAKAIRKGFDPHTQNKSPRYKPRGNNEAFLVLDYKSMEICTLQWLSEDDELERVLRKSGDTWGNLWEAISGDVADDESRKACKSLFLPVCYGSGPKVIAESLKISENSAKELISITRSRFPIADRYLQNCQEAASSGMIRNHFGRPRVLGENESPYLARNFVIQSAAAAVCLEKLIHLHHSLPEDSEIAFHVHDGYAIICPLPRFQDVYAIAKKSLETPSQLASELRLKVAAKVGLRLHKLIDYPPRKG